MQLELMSYPIKGSRNESESVRQENLPQLQNHQARGYGQGDLH